MCVHHCNTERPEKVNVELNTDAGMRAHLEVAPVHFWNAVWLATFAPPAGRELIKALASDSENVRLVASMHLINAECRSVDLLIEALDSGKNLNEVLSVVTAIQERTPSQALNKKLRQMQYSSQTDVAAAAKNALAHIGQHA